MRLRPMFKTADVAAFSSHINTSKLLKPNSMYDLSGFKFKLGYISDFPEKHPREGERMKIAKFDNEIGSPLFGLSPKSKDAPEGAQHGLTTAFSRALGVLEGKWAVGKSQACMYVDAGASSTQRQGRLLTIALRSGTRFQEGGTIRDRSDVGLKDIHILDASQVIDRHRAFVAVYVPDRGDFGLAVVGSHNGNNIDTICKSFLAQILTSNAPDRIRVQIDKELTRSRLRQFIKDGNVHGIELSRKGVPKNKVKEVLGKVVKFAKASLSVKITFQDADSAWLVKRYDAWRNGTTVATGRYFMSDDLDHVGLGENEAVQEKVVVVNDGKQVTKQLADFFKSAPSVSVGEDALVLEDDGKPTYESLSKQIVLYLDELIDDLLS